MREEVLTLPDGRKLGLGVYGNPAGFPVLDFHGIPGSRGEARLIADSLQDDSLCLIGIDRPGYGRSSWKKRFRVNDFAPDAAAVLDHLGYARVAVLGYSGGGPFALDFARQFPQRVSALGIVSGVGPAGIGSEGMHESNRSKFNLAQRMPSVARLLLRTAFSSLRKDPEKLRAQLLKIWQQMPLADQQALAHPEFAEGIIGITLDAVSAGVEGWANEEILMAQPWGFNLEEINIQRIFLYHGVQDKNVPLAMAKAVAAGLKNCQPQFLENEGHISILYNHGKEILARLRTASE